MLESPPETQRILVVDDNSYTLRIVQHTLEQAGYEVSTAISGPEGLKLINRHGLPHLAIVDLHMPEMSGFEFCRTIHEFSDVPVVMLTAANSEETIIEGLDEHAEDYMVKPFNPPELIARVRRVLGRMEDYTYTLESTTRIDERLMVNFPLREATVDGETIPAGDTSAADDRFVAVTAPVLGTFYRRPSPEEEPFVTVGASVNEGDQIGLIEVMKSYHEVVAPASGVITEILAEDGNYVEFGQPLASIRSL